MFLVFMLVVCFPRAFSPSHQPRFYYTSVNLSFPIAPLLLSCRKKTRSDKSLHIFDYNDVECVSHAYFSFFPLVDILFLFFNSSPTRICYLLFPFFVQSTREHFSTSLFKAFCSLYHPPPSAMILKFAIYGSLLLHVLFFILFYVVSIFKKCYFRLFSARYFCIEFKSYQKCQLRRFLFISVSVRSNFFAHMLLDDSVMMLRSFLFFNCAIFVLVFIFCLCWIGTLIWFSELSSQYISTC